MSINLKSVVSKHLPEYVREDYPLFVAFIEAYYEYLDQYEKRDLIELRDIDDTLDSFVQFFKNELDVFGENYPFINQKLLLRKVKELFLAKGVESSYEFLFKILFNKKAEISYPWDSVLKASDGKWNQDMSVFVDISTGNPNTLPGNRINILGPNVTIKVYVNRVRLVRDNIYEVFINKDYYGNIQVDYTISYEGITGTIIPTTVSYSVTQPGSGYKVGQLITAQTISNGQTIEQLFKIIKVNSTGGIVNIVTVKFGCGYDAGFYLLKSNAPITSDSTIEITKESIVQYTLADGSTVDKYTDYGYIINPNYNALNYDDVTYAGTVIQNFYQESLSGQGANPDYLLIRFDIGAVAKYQGYYNTNDGFLDDDIVIQDSYRWQKYSYLITVDESLEKYKALLKSYLHPAGTALFGEYQIQNTFNVGITGSLQLGQWVSKATFGLINKNITTDYTYAIDEGGIISVEPYGEGDYFAIDELYNPPVSYTFTG